MVDIIKLLSDNERYYSKEIKLSKTQRKLLSKAFYEAKNDFLNDNDFFVQGGCEDRDFMAGYAEALDNIGFLFNEHDCNRIANKDSELTQDLNK